MPFLTALLAAMSIFLILYYSIDLYNKRKENKNSLYEDIINVYENDDRTVRAIETRSFIERIAIMLEASNLPLDMKELIVISLSLYIFVGYMIGAFIGSLFIGFFSGFIPLLILYLYMKRAIKNKSQKVVHQLPEFAIIFASGYDAGYSVENCFDYCSKELKQPIKNEMLEIYTDITEKKLSLVDGLKNWYERIPNVDILFVIKGLLLCQEKSGDVSEIMKSLQEKLRDRSSIDRFIQKKTQGLRFLAKIIKAIPILALLFAFLANSTKFGEFASSIFGIIGFIICTFLYVFGTLLINIFIKSVYKD